MIRKAIAKVVERENLTEAAMIDVMGQIMSGGATPAQVAAFITALRMKGETVEEVTGAARVMRERVTRIRAGRNPLDIDRHEIDPDMETVLDTCGTGGSGLNTFNISTTVALVVAACGVKVAKHGNRSISSSCGSADVLESLGVNLEVSTEVVERCISEIGIGFLFAPVLHDAMKYAGPPRREIGIRTIFNILGPLTNPAGADCQVLGVYRENLVDKLAHVLKNLGCRRGFVVHGKDGMDEITLTTETYIAEVSPEGVTARIFRPEDLGLVRCRMEELHGGNAIDNAKVVRSILSGVSGPRRDIVLLNAAYALLAAGKVVDPSEGLKVASTAISSGRVLDKLEQLVRLTNE